MKGLKLGVLLLAGVLLAPALVMATGLVAFAVVPAAPGIGVTDLNVNLFGFKLTGSLLPMLSGLDI